MKKTLPKRKSAARRPAFADGQVWELAESRIHISKVGKTLVHYKHFRGELKRAPVSLASQRTLEQYLIGKKAVLVRA